MSASTSNAPPSPSPPQLDPPFRGYIETTYDSLLVFEAARRGLIPRVTRRLIERERGMVQSGAVFVFDEQESGIKRWTDGLIWSPSRILGNFLVYRETDKRSTAAENGSNPDSPPDTPARYIVGPGQMGESSQSALQIFTPMGDIPILAQGAIRPRSTSEGGLDKQKERQLVGSLTNSYKFREGGLVKKTMSVSIGNYSQHMISYYTVADVMSGKLRAPSTIPELAGLEISADYLQKQNFRFPPLVEIGQDGVPRYRGEAEETMSPSTPISGFSLSSALPTPSDPFGNLSHSRGSAHLQIEPPRSAGHSRGYTHPQHTPTSFHPPSSAHPLQSPGHFVPTSASSQYFDNNYSPTAPPPSAALPIPIQRQASGGPHRPGSFKSRYDPYGSSPRVASLGISPVGPPPLQHYGPSSAGMHPGSSMGSDTTYSHRRQSVPQPPSHQHEYLQQLHAPPPHQIHPQHQLQHQQAQQRQQQQQHHQHHQQQMHQQQQQQQQQQDYYQQYDVKPIIDTSGAASYPYQPPHTAPSAFGSYYSSQTSVHPPASITTITSPIIAYTPTPTSAGHGAHPSQHPPFPSPTWHSTPTSAPPGSQSRLLPSHSREYGRLSLHGHRPGSNESHPNQGQIGYGIARPPSSSSPGSAAGSAGRLVSGGESSYGAQGHQGNNQGGWGRPSSATSSRSNLVSPIQGHNPTSALGLLPGPGQAPSLVAPPIPPPTAEMGGSMGAMGVAQYSMEEGWNQAAA